jgi:DNA-binding transcriptional regulator LsrR (DeoR family)
MFAETVVRCKDFNDLKKHPGIREVFEERDKNDIVVNSMGDLEDEHDLLGTFLRDAKIDVPKMLEQGVIGSVQDRPFTAKGPYKEKPGDNRAATVFELEDFVRMADSHHHHVVLIARQCGADNCGLSRARSLRPLLTIESLRVFSEIVMDVATAQDLMKSETNSNGILLIAVIRGCSFLLAFQIQ